MSAPEPTRGSLSENLQAVLFRLSIGVFCTLLVAEIGALAGLELSAVWLTSTIAGIFVAAAAD